jgi:hypothetical protein
MRHFATPFMILGLLPAQVPTAQSAKLELKVLYAGVAGPRSDEWRAFLEARTTACKTITTEQLTKAAADGFDVVVVDCPDPITRNDSGVESLNMPKGPDLGVDFGRPTVFVGAMAMVPHRLNLMLGWL